MHTPHMRALTPESTNAFGNIFFSLDDTAFNYLAQNRTSTRFPTPLKFL
ncbi:protein of unknown function [Candidatus Filomicrobium marinum]|uniref:Uncharacterized protein n=1 Tax=Candidatus Filomicrobium marinum TaxID=1608628 RepID=A0A0D6JC37_9HYPH|nr:protein of unknown function [Candidatus Filomicrobium marinum]CPR16571.1 protein of unknown function [Candidatus Filomicrobium marinum]